MVTAIVEPELWQRGMVWTIVFPLTGESHNSGSDPGLTEAEASQMGDGEKALTDIVTHKGPWDSLLGTSKAP